MTRIVRTVVTLALLVAGSIGYEHLYAIVAARVQPPAPPRSKTIDLRPSASLSAQQAEALARRYLGEHHWTSGTVSDVGKYYNAERGYWMFWSKLEFPDEHDRRQIVLSPFAVIWASNKDGSVKIMTGDRAIIDFDQPFNFLVAGPKPSVVHAKIEGIDEQVLILDEKGTPDPADDLVITVPYAEYFEKQMQIRCDEQVQLVEGDVTVGGRGLVIALRPSESSGGFPGAEVVTLSQKVVINVQDVGRTGILPGAATPDQQVAATGDGGAAATARTPARLMCDGPMRMQLPKPRLPARVGPPAPPQPTIAEFARNVVIERGAEQPDRITGDNLYAVLVPRDPPAAPEGQEAPPPAAKGGGAGAGLRLLEARVDGHVVWLELTSEKVRGRGNELIYRKPEQAEPEVTYFRADQGKQVEFERTKVDLKGQATSLETILAADMTMHGDAEQKGRSTVIARGPVTLEIRSGRDAPVERSATCRGEMIVESSLRPSDPNDDSTRTFITLLGWPILNDPKQLTLAARDRVDVSLKPRPAASNAPSGGSAEAGGRSFQIEWVSAVGDVHMVTHDRNEPGAAARPGKPRRRDKLNAREKLDVVFTYLDDAPAPAGMMTSTPSRTSARTLLASQTGPATGSTPDARAEAPLADVPPSDSSSSGSPSDATAVAGADGPAVEPDPPFSADADVIWARVEVTGQGPSLDPATGQGGTQEVREARLRQDVVIHQDPAPGKETGFHVDADHGVDLENAGPGRMKVYAHGESRPVTVASDDFYIQGFPEDSADGRVVLGVDQAFDYAFVQGPGRLWNLTNKKAMGRLDLASSRREESPGGGKEPMIVTWADEMRFFGRFAEPDGRPGPARALFLGDVRSRHGDSGAMCQEMEAIFDRPVSFDRALPGQESAGGSGTPTEGRVEIASVICNGQVELWSLVGDANSPVDYRELREAYGESVTFDREADHFWIDGAGCVSVATLDDGKGRPGGDPIGIIPASYQEGEAEGGAARPPSRRLPVNKTHIAFNDGVEGQLGSAGGGYRAAEFRGDARAIRAEVAQFRDPLDFDDPPRGSVLLDGDTIYVEHNPAVAGGPPDRNFLKAFGTAQARSEGRTLLGDSITYDSVTNLFFVKGSPATPVTIASQEAFGQPTSRSYARSVIYNAKTGVTDFRDPGAAIFFRPNTGYRIGAVEPTPEKPEEEPKRPEPRLPANSDLERKGFTGN